MNMPVDQSTLTATLVMDEAVRSQLKVSLGALAVAQSFNLDPADPDSDEIATLARQELDSIRARAKKLEETRVGFVKPAREIMERAQALFVPAIEGLKQAENLLKGRLLDWQTGRAKLAAEAKAKAEAEARRIQQEAEARAAAERARAAEREREAQAKAAAAEEARRKAAEEAEAARRAGDAKAAAAKEAEARRQAAEKAKQEEAERRARDEAERKSREAELKAAAEAEAARRQAEQSQVQTASLVNSRDNWIAELEEGKTEQDVIRLLAVAIAGGRSDLITLLKLDLAAAKKLAGAQKNLTQIPGMRVRNVPIPTAARTKKGA